MTILTQFYSMYKNFLNDFCRNCGLEAEEKDSIYKETKMFDFLFSTIFRWRHWNKHDFLLEMFDLIKMVLISDNKLETVL